MRILSLTTAALAAVIAALVGCSSNSPAKHVITSATTSAASSTPTDVDTSSPAGDQDSSSAQASGTIDLAPNWSEMKSTLQKDWDGKCPLAYSCTGQGALDEGPISAEWINVPGQQSITVSFIANDPSDDSAAKLDLGHFALFFSTDAGSQFDFSQAVSDAIDAIGIGATKTVDFPPLELTVEHPTAAKWQFKVDQSPA